MKNDTTKLPIWYISYLCTYCANGETENEIYFFLECRKYDALHKVTSRRIKKLEEINFETVKQRLLFPQR